MVWAWIVIAAFFGIWIGVAVYGKTQHWSGIYRFGGGLSPLVSSWGLDFQ
jgi:hypothetical protein